MVFDASVIVKVLTEEPLSALAAQVLAQEPHRLAPDILAIEVASALSKKARYTGLPRTFVDAALHALPELSIETTACATLVDEAMSLSIRWRCALYDCFYLALAERRDSRLVTADDRFAAVVEATPLAARLLRLSDWNERIVE